ncbi:effector-associated domain EAD1-containing protein [Dactylosporangium sp. CS-047395]|uniref:effector-associated domain EAD1-containing protein n=1 Tax=Dactylosporangium sp. CS-047395 TaxID=3239936 RepID=UPI003D8B77FF
MSGPLRAELIRRLAAAYPDRTRLELALLEMDVAIDDFSARPDSALTVLTALFNQGDAGWQREIAAGLIARVPNHRDLQRFAADNGLTAAPPPEPAAAAPARLPFLRITDFDLSDVRADLLETVTAEPTVQGFAIPTDEELVGATMCDFLAETHDSIETRPAINLGATSTEVDRPVERVCNYAFELEDGGIALPVLIAESDAERIAKFWVGVRAGLTHIRYPLMLLFLRADRSVELPPEVPWIAGPSMRPGHVKDLVGRAAANLALSRATADAWIAWVLRGQREQLDVRITIDRLRPSLARAQDDPAAFARWIAGRDGHGHA